MFLKEAGDGIPRISHRINLGWGVSYYRSALVREAAELLDIRLEPLLGNSPDFMHVEHLWQWLREDVVYHTCYDYETDLINQVKCFERRINADPYYGS